MVHLGIWASFRKSEACGQTVLPDRSFLIGLGGKCQTSKNSSATFWVIFKQCVYSAVLNKALIFKKAPTLALAEFIKTTISSSWRHLAPLEDPVHFPISAITGGTLHEIRLMKSTWIGFPKTSMLLPPLLCYDVFFPVISCVSISCNFHPKAFFWLKHCAMDLNPPKKLSNWIKPNNGASIFSWLVLLEKNLWTLVWHGSCLSSIKRIFE